MPRTCGWKMPAGWVATYEKDLMNERIKQLAEQAYLYQEHDTFLTAALENFAKLIVRECADFANDHNSEVEGVTLGVGQALKQHFGVEE